MRGNSEASGPPPAIELANRNPVESTTLVVELAAPGMACGGTSRKDGGMGTQRRGGGRSRKRGARAEQSTVLIFVEAWILASLVHIIRIYTCDQVMKAVCLRDAFVQHPAREIAGPLTQRTRRNSRPSSKATRALQLKASCVVTLTLTTMYAREVNPRQCQLAEYRAR